jgi:predicted PurR-regulated permease PerM
MKSSLKISPILVIIAVVVGGAYLGIVGMFLAVPVAVIIKQILLEYIASKEHEDISDVTDGRR